MNKKSVSLLLALALCLSFSVMVYAQGESKKTLEDFWRESYQSRIAYHAKLIDEYSASLSVLALDDPKVELLECRIEYSEQTIQVYQDKLDLLE